MYEILLGVKKGETEINILTQNNLRDTLLSKKKSSQCKEQINTTFSSINKWKNKTLDFCVSICVFIYVHMQIYAKRKVWKSMPVDKHFFL